MAGFERICTLNQTNSERDANAHFICLACNSHSDLVGALEGLLAIQDGRITSAQEQIEMFSQARNALAKAKEGI